MVTPPLETDQIIASSEARYSSRGLLLSYALMRIKGFWSRQIITIVFAITIMVTGGVYWGLLAGGLVLLGDAMELGYLHVVRKRLDDGREIRSILFESTALSALQACTKGACFCIAWTTIETTEASFFCFAFLTAAAMNAGIARPLHPRATDAKLIVLGLFAFGALVFEFFLLSGDSTKFWYDVVAAFMMGYVVNVFVDHTSRSFRRARASERDLLRKQKIMELGALELQEKQKELRLLSMVARHANDAVVLSDKDQRITWVNGAFTKMTGYDANEAIGKRPGDLLNCKETSKEAVAELAQRTRAGEPTRIEILNRRKNGELIWVETNVVPIISAEGEVEMHVAVERDVTQAKLHAQELAEARRDAERGERAKSEFLATMSHEIRTPMNGVIGMADLLCEGELSAENRMYANTIRTSAKALLKIINDILDFSKLDAGKLTIDPVDFAPGPMILDVLDILRPRAQEKNLYLDVNFATRLPSKVHGDDGRIRQILINLVGNAIKFTEHGGVTVKVKHKATSEGVEMDIEVKDTGIGIAEDQIDHIFEHFSQADAATTRKFGGTGLGLSISRLLAEQMGGGIGVTSAQAKGSVFTLSLALNKAQDEDPLQSDEAFFSPVDSLKGLRILLAEDNQTNRLLVDRYLKDFAVDLHVVTNGRQAIEAMAKGRFDVVLMDMSMPEMDGLEATRHIRRDYPTHPKIIALTANAFRSDQQACFDAGMDDFLSKPISKSALLHALSQVDKREKPTQNARKAM